MKVKYGIISQPAAGKKVDRTIGIAAAVRYLNARGKLTDEQVNRSCDDIIKQRTQ